MEKKISVIVPCYNVEKYIDRCVESLVNQTIGVENLELIFVDDSSEDSTLDKLQKWEEKYSDSILVVVCDQNGRQGTARNIGAEYSSCPYLIYIDADDWIEWNMLECMYQAAVEYDVEVTACNLGRDWGDGVLFDVSRYNGAVNQLVQIQSDEDRRDLLKLNFGPVVAKLYKKSFLVKNQIFFPEGLAYEDNYFGNMVIYCVKSYFFLDSTFYHYYCNTESTVMQKNAMHQLDRLEVALLTKEELFRRGFADSFSEEIEREFIKIYYLNTLHILFTRYDQLPYDILDEMQAVVLQQYPNCLRDRVYEKMGPFHQSIMSTLKRKLLPREWDDIARSYREFCIEMDSSLKVKC